MQCCIYWKKSFIESSNISEQRESGSMHFSSLSHLLKSGTCKEAAQASEVETDAKKCGKESGMGPAFRIHRQEATTWTLGMECCFRKKMENYVNTIFTIWERLFSKQNLETSIAAIFLVWHFATLQAIQCSDELCIFRYWVENLEILPCIVHAVSMHQKNAGFTF